MTAIQNASDGVTVERSALGASVAHVMQVPYIHGMSWKEVVHKASTRTLNITNPTQDEEFTLTSSIDLHVQKLDSGIDNSHVYLFKRTGQENKKTDAKHHAKIVQAAWKRRGYSATMSNNHNPSLNPIYRMFDDMFGIDATHLVHLSTLELANYWGELYCAQYNEHESHSHKKQK